MSRREQRYPYVPSMHATHAHTHSMRLTTSAHLPHRNQVLTAFWLRSCSHHVCSDKILRIMRHARPATRQHSIAARLRACLLDQKLAQSRFFSESKNRAFANARALVDFPLVSHAVSNTPCLCNSPKKNGVTGWYKSRRRRYGGSGIPGRPCSAWRAGEGGLGAWRVVIMCLP